MESKLQQPPNLYLNKNNNSNRNKNPNLFYLQKIQEPSWNDKTPEPNNRLIPLIIEQKRFHY